MSSISMDSDVNRIITFWFNAEEPIKRWFSKDSDLDAEIRDKFGSLVEQARASQLQSWTQEPKGTLALLILLDQFPRNIFRGSPLSYSSDEMAVSIASEAIAKGVDKEVSTFQQPFFYLPLMHDERLISQIASTALYEGLVKRCTPDTDEANFAVASVGFAKHHRDVISKFGRFPSRNEILGRKSTPEEIQFLKEHPGV